MITVVGMILSLNIVLTLNTFILYLLWLNGFGLQLTQDNVVF